jgi:hypothetical protein
VPFVKIGLTRTSPAQRIREVNASKTYGPLGKWMQIDVRVVRNVSLCERALHIKYRERLVRDDPAMRELFHLTPEEAREALSSIPEVQLARDVPVNRLRVRPDFMHYLMGIFRTSGLETFRDLQESWTFSLFPSTGGGRFFTLNIDRHEVAFSFPVKDRDDVAGHCVVVDEMVARDKEAMNWLKKVDGWMKPTPYASNWGQSVALHFEASFDQAAGLSQISGFRRALVAYWYDALLRMRDGKKRSLFARFHDYDAVSEVFRHLEETDRFVSPS